MKRVSLLLRMASTAALSTHKTSVQRKNEDEKNR
jgi:hypothetical protein